MLEIKRSYARKIQMENYGGNKYETMDFFSSYKKSEIPDDTSEEKASQISRRLHDLAEEDVEEQIKKMNEKMYQDKTKKPPF